MFVAHRRAHYYPVLSTTIASGRVPGACVRARPAAAPARWQAAGARQRTVRTGGGLRRSCGSRVRIPPRSRDAAADGLWRDDCAAAHRWPDPFSFRRTRTEPQSEPKPQPKPKHDPGLVARTSPPPTLPPHVPTLIDTTATQHKLFLRNLYRR